MATLSLWKSYKARQLFLPLVGVQFCIGVFLFSSRSTFHSSDNSLRVVSRNDTTDSHTIQYSNLVLRNFSLTKIPSLASKVLIHDMNLTAAFDIRLSIRQLQTLVEQQMIKDPPDFTESDNLYLFGIEVPKDISTYHKNVLDICAREIAIKNYSLPESMDLCPCIPDDIKNKILDVKPRYSSYEKVAEHLGTEEELGGFWTPKDCVARRRIAIIVPFRDRYEHLQAFLRHMIPVLRGQRLEYRIFVVEQMFPYIFNKGSLMNAGFLEVMQRFHCDCVLFHDVDMLAETRDNMIFCHNTIVHVGAYVDKFKYKLIYPNIFGGAVAIQPAYFCMLNGYSNTFYGWGGEDDNFYSRIRRSGFRRYRGPNRIAKYKMIRHKRDFNNPVGYGVKNHWWGYRRNASTNYFEDGLNNVNYSVEIVRELKLFTQIVVSLKDVPTHGVQPPVYTAYPGDCFLNDLESLGPLSKSTCQKACDDLKKCVGFVNMISDDVPMCFLKKKPCDAEHISEKNNSIFYMKPDD